MPERPMIWFGWGPWVSGPEGEFNHMGNQWTNRSCLCTEASIRNLDTEAGVSFPGWQYCVCTTTHRCQGSNESQGQGTLCGWEPSLTDSLSLPLANFNLYSLPVINSNHKYNSFQWNSVSPLANYQIKEWFWEPHELVWCGRAGPSNLAVWLTVGIVPIGPFTTCLPLDKSHEPPLPQFLHLHSTYPLAPATSKT